VFRSALVSAQNISLFEVDIGAKVLSVQKFLDESGGAKTPWAVKHRYVLRI